MTWNASIVCIIVSPCKNRPLKSVTLSGYFLWTNIIKLPDVPFRLSCASVSASMLIVANSGYNTVNAQLFEVVNAGTLAGGSLEWAEFSQRLEQLSSFLLRRSDGSRMLNHTSFREWLMWREEGQDDRFLCDPRYSQRAWVTNGERRKQEQMFLIELCVSVSRSGHTLLSFWLCRQAGKLTRQQTLELGHHILKAHIYKASSHTQVRHAYADTWVGNHTRRFFLQITNQWDATVLCLTVGFCHICSPHPGPE